MFGQNDHSIITTGRCLIREISEDWLIYCLCFWYIVLQRNHSLFGTVMNALAGVHKTTLPFAGRTQSLLINHNQMPKISPEYNSINSPHTNISPQNSVNGKVTPADSHNHLNVEYRNALNRSPSPSPVGPVRVSPAVSNESRRPSQTPRYTSFIISIAKSHITSFMNEFLLLSFYG